MRVLSVSKSCDRGPRSFGGVEIVRARMMHPAIRPDAQGVPRFPELFILSNESHSHAFFGGWLDQFA